MFTNAVTYTRAQAIADGVLIDPGKIAKEAGFKPHVAITSAVWARAVDWDNGTENTYQDISARLWDVLFMAAFEARKQANSGENIIFFGLYSVPRGGIEAEEITLKLIAGPGDNGELVITILEELED